MRFASKTGDTPAGACPTRNAPTGVIAFLRRDFAPQAASPSSPPRAASPGLGDSPPRSTTRQFNAVHARVTSCLDAIHHGIHSGSGTLVGDSRRRQLEHNSDVESQFSPGFFLVGDPSFADATYVTHPQWSGSRSALCALAPTSSRLPSDAATVRREIHQ